MTATDTQLQRDIDRALAGDGSAHATLIDHACDRLVKLTRKLFHRHPDLRGGSRRMTYSKERC